MHCIGDYVRSRTDNDDGESYLGHNIAVITVPVLLTRNLASIAHMEHREGCHET